jgi:hypothetical protein
VIPFRRVDYFSAGDGLLTMLAIILPFYASLNLSKGLEARCSIGILLKLFIDYLRAHNPSTVAGLDGNGVVQVAEGNVKCIRRRGPRNSHCPKAILSLECVGKVL